MPDPATGPNRCAAFWPRQAGWHRLQSGGREQLFHVRARSAAMGLHAGEMREATQRLAAQATRAVSDATTSHPQPGTRWPWWLGWLLASATLWWFERSRLGRVA
jgi:hypothetical protein